VPVAAVGDQLLLCALERHHVELGGAEVLLDARQTEVSVEEGLAGEQLSDRGELRRYVWQREEALHGLAQSTQEGLEIRAVTLYWFLPEATSLSVAVTIVDPNGVEPLLETTLPGPLAAGIHAVPLSKHGVRLAPNVEYQWFVAVIVDPARRARDVVSGGSIRSAPAADPAATAARARLAHAYAEAGLWYDALEQLSAWLEAEPDAKVLHAHRAALLEQVGLAEAARYERGLASGAPPPR